jgi:chromosome segregation ATPase
MDDRKRVIADLELKKKESRRSLEATYEDFGTALFDRFSGRETVLGENAEEYQRLQREITDSEGLIRLTEAETQRLKKLEEEILAKEREHAAFSKELLNAYIDLGRDAVEDDAYAAALGSFRQQIGLLLPKLEDAKAKLDELEERAGPGIFNWIGKSAQGAVYRTLMVKYEGSLKKLYAGAGEKLAGPEYESLVAGYGLEESARAARGMKETAFAQVQELDRLREERRRLGTAFGAEGGPVRRIQNLEKHIAYIRSELKLVYRRLGEDAADESQGARFAAALVPEDRQVLDIARRSKEIIAEYDRKIEKLKTAIAIDEERAEIEKIQRAIADQQQKISAAEGRIGELKTQIGEAEARIEELSRLL